jgi:HK97 family phage major capsid protein
MTAKSGYVLRGYDVSVSEYMPNYNDGATANGIPFIVFGDFKEYILTLTKPLEIVGSSEAYFKSDLYAYRGTMHFDGGVRRGEAFLGITNKKA